LIKSTVGRGWIAVLAHGVGPEVLPAVSNPDTHRGDSEIGRNDLWRIVPIDNLRHPARTRGNWQGLIERT
jgi:hypothetical protein